MSDNTKKEVVLYYKIFGALGVLTLVTVALNYLHVGMAVAIILALIVATTKASLVASFFMHLNHEKNVIYMVLGFTALFFIGMLGLTMASYYSVPEGTLDTNKQYKIDIAAHEGHHGEVHIEDHAQETADLPEEARH